MDELVTAYYSGGGPAHTIEGRPVLAAFLVSQNEWILVCHEKGTWAMPRGPVGETDGFLVVISQYAGHELSRRRIHKDGMAYMEAATEAAELAVTRVY